MILVRFTGGLGNQMFQYALGMYLALMNKTELKIDTTLLLDHSLPHEIVTHRNLDIDIFHVNLQTASQKEIWKFNGRPYSHLPGKIYNKILWKFILKKNLVLEKQRNFQPEIVELPDNKCLVGAWQSEKYFKPAEAEIRKHFTFKDALSGAAFELGKEIAGQNAVCLNVRRGDYITSPIYSKTLGAMPLEYYMKGLEQIKSRQAIGNVFVFSDDIIWCKENFKFPGAIVVEHSYAGPKFSTYLHLMSLCKHFIIPNSSFGWWAAWLSTNKDKVVVAPRNWYKDPANNSDDLIPEKWIRI